VARRLLVKVTCGTDDPERSNQGLTVASAGVASGAPVSLWLTGEAAWFATPDRAPDLSLPHATPAAELVQVVREGGGQVTLCTQCAARRGLGESDVLPDVRIAGAAVFVEEALGQDTQALVY
jgi:predicted peroxiredoxin